MERLVATHNAKDDSGRIYEVFEYQKFIDASTHDGPGQIAGLKRLALRDGSPVNYKDENTFYIVLTDTTIYRS